MRSRPYWNDRIIKMIQHLFFTGEKSLVTNFSHCFPTSEGPDGVMRSKVPEPMVALVATAVSWGFGNVTCVVLTALMSQPPPRVTVSHPIVLIVRTPLLIALFHVCALPPFVVTVTIPVPDSLLSFRTIVFPHLLFCLPRVLFYCLCVSIVCYFLLFLRLYCSLPSIVLSGLLPSTG